MAIPSEYSYLLETVDFLWRNTQIYAIASGKSMRYYSSSYNICYQPANECSFLSYNEQSSSFQNAKMIATTVGSIRITDNGGTITVSYDNFKLNFWSEYNQKWIEWIEPDGTYGDYLEVPHTGSWKTSQTVDFRNFQTSFNSLSDACNYIYYNFKHCYIYYNNELWVNPNPPEPITSNGGGATHIAKVTGQLKDLSSNLSDILMVSGGGGGGLLVGDTDYSGKEAGGISGSGDNSADQSTGNAFGQGESGTNVSGGGSGLYGGYKGTSAKSGGAGSGYIGNSLLSNKKMVGYNVPTSSAEGTKTESVNEVSASAVSGKPKSGNGFARIKFLREVGHVLFKDIVKTTDKDHEKHTSYDGSNPGVPVNNLSSYFETDYILSSRQSNANYLASFNGNEGSGSNKSSSTSCIIYYPIPKTFIKNVKYKYKFASGSSSQYAYVNVGLGYVENGQIKYADNVVVKSNTNYQTDWKEVSFTINTPKLFDYLVMWVCDYTWMFKDVEFNYE